MKDMVQIGRACFIGGALCFGITLLAAPNLWWLGILAGLASGYLAYEFRAVIRAVPMAYSIAKVVLQELRSEAASIKIDLQQLRDYFRRPHPFGRVYLVSNFIFAAALFYLVVTDKHGAREVTELGYVIFAFFCSIAAVIPAFFVFLAVSVLAEIGAVCMEQSHWSKDSRQFIDDDEDREKHNKPRLSIEPLTHRNVVRWTWKGLLFVFVVGPFRLLRAIVEAIWWAVKMAVLLPFWTLYHVLRIIHMEYRVLCAIDGTLGGCAMIWYTRYFDPTWSMPEQLIAVVAAGSIGAVLGIVNYELVSVRLFGFERIRPRAS